MPERAERIAELLGWHKAWAFFLEGIKAEPEIISLDENFPEHYADVAWACHLVWVGSDGLVKGWVASWNPEHSEADALMALVEWRRHSGGYFLLQGREEGCWLTLGGPEATGLPALKAQVAVRPDNLCEAICAALDKLPEED